MLGTHWCDMLTLSQYDSEQAPLYSPLITSPSIAFTRLHVPFAHLSLSLSLTHTHTHTHTHNELKV